MSPTNWTTHPTFSQFITRALAYHGGRMFRRADGSWQIGDNASARKVRVRQTPRGLEAWQPATGQRLMWAA